MDQELIKNSLLKSKSNLSAYLEDLDTASKDKEIIVKSRWPWKGKVVSVYPESLGQLLVLFFKTLRFDISKQTQAQYLNHSIQILNTYKNAVQYELLATKPKWLFQEQYQLARLDDWLNNLLAQMESEPGISGDRKEDLYEWAGRLDDFPTFLSSRSLLQLINMAPEEQRQCINQIREKIQERIQVIPGLVQKAISEAEGFFDQHRPVGKQREIHEIGSTIDSLFNFFITEKPRPEMVAVYQQLAKAAMIWRQANKEIQSEFQPKLLDFYQFFHKTVDNYGAARDLAAGLAYAELFLVSNKPIPPSTPAR